MAVYHHEKRVEVAHELGDDKGTLRTYAFYDLARAWEKKMKFSQASECYRSMWEATGGKQAHGGVIGGGAWGMLAAAGLARCSERAGDWVQAEQWGRLSLDGAIQVGDSAAQAFFQVLGPAPLLPDAHHLPCLRGTHPHGT